MARKHNATLKVMEGGRITIPSQIRELENIRVGSFVKVTIEKIETGEWEDDPVKEDVSKGSRSN
jgi:bifunctional DNA-binding transcriptional regulator/antitoxin component of YhaV-PrlF toxin-antitoxin module